MHSAIRVRLLVALAAVALLILAWLAWEGARRTRAGRTEAITPSGAAAKQATDDEGAAGPGAKADEEEGCGEEERTYRVTVVSRRDGTPIAGARVCWGDDTCYATTGADGVAEFRAPSGTRWYVSAPGFFPLHVDLDGDGNGWVALPPATIVTGKVFDAATRRPIQGADVTLWAEDFGHENATTDGAGRFEVVGALWQGYKLVVQAESYTPAEVEGSLTGPLHGLEIALAAGATLQGSVFHADGVPAEGARIFLMAGEEAVPNVEARSDVQGEFEIAGVPLGVKLVLCVEDGRGGCRDADPVVFRDPGEVQRRDIRFPVLATLTVTVRGPDGEAIDLHEVCLEHEGGFIGPRSRSEDWSFEASPGRYRLAVFPVGWPNLTREVILEAGGTREEIVFSRGLAIEGTVLAMDGSPLDDGVYWRSETLRGTSWTDEEGRFRIDGLRAEPTHLFVSVRDHALATRECVMPGGPPVAIRLQPVAKITGRVVGHTRALHALIWSESSGDKCDIEDDGRFEFVIDQGDEPVILAFCPSLEAPVVLSLPPLAAGEARDVGEIRFDVGRTVRGKVLGADAKPAVGALVDLVEFWSEEGGARSTRTDESGRFCLLRMPRAAFWVRVDMEGYPPHFLRVEEDAVELRLTTGGVAAGRGEASFSPAGPACGWWAHKATIVATPEADGGFSVRLQPGQYRGWTRDEKGNGHELVPFVIREGETTKVEIKPR